MTLPGQSDMLPWWDKSPQYRAALDELFEAVGRRGINGAASTELAADLGWSAPATLGKLKMLAAGSAIFYDDGRWFR